MELLFSCGTAYIGGYTEGYLPREDGITPDRVKQHASGVLRENRSTGRQKILGGGGGRVPGSIWMIEQVKVISV